MLVDGCLLDNVPMRTMHQLKSGPNVVVSFHIPELQRFDVDYAALPSRAELIQHEPQPVRARPPARGAGPDHRADALADGQPRRLQSAAEAGRRAVRAADPGGHGHSRLAPAHRAVRAAPTGGAWTSLRG